MLLLLPWCCLLQSLVWSARRLLLMHAAQVTRGAALLHCC
jgi:hypothetical protein